MTLRDFRIGWRLLIGEPAYSAVVVGGLALGFAACFLLLGFVLYTFGYNSEVPGADRIFLVKRRTNVFPRPEWSAQSGMPLRDAALKSGMADSASIVKRLDFPVKVGTTLHKVELDAVDPAFPGMFGITAIEGDLTAALARPDGLALSSNAARKLFGHASALGRTVHVAGWPLQVRAVMSDPPANTTRSYEALVGIDSEIWPAAQRSDDFAHWQYAEIYVGLKPGVPAAALAQILEDAAAMSAIDTRVRLGHMGKGLAGRKVTEIRVTALPDVYFDADLAASRMGNHYGRKESVLGLAAIAILILLLAGTNYVNLATIRTLRRQREIGLRKLLGARAPHLAGQFLAESTLVALLAAVLGLALAWLLLPLYADLVDRNLSGFFTPLHCACALVFSLALGLAAGTYPALIAMRVHPARALSDRAGGEPRGTIWLRRAMTVLQFACAMGLTAIAITVGWQADYARTAAPGFDSSRLFVLDFPDHSSAAQQRSFAVALAHRGDIAGVATISDAVGREDNTIVGDLALPEGRRITIELKTVSPGFFQVYGVAPLFGRLFDPAIDHADGDSLVINAAAALAMGYPTPQAAVGKLLPADGDNSPRPRTIVGITPDLRYRTLRQATQPMVFLLGSATVLTLRSASPAIAYAGIEAVWRRYFPDDLLELNPAQSFFAANYADDARVAGILGAASVVAIVLAAFGVYVLSAYNVQRSRREIVLRKLHGASRTAIALMLGREFAVMIGLGAAIGLPPAALAGQRYLAGFVERAPLGAWPLLAALAATSLVALLATARHTLAAMRLTPAQALRD